MEFTLAVLRSVVNVPTVIIGFSVVYLKIFSVAVFYREVYLLFKCGYLLGGQLVS